MRMRELLFVVVVSGCGGSSAPPPQAPMSPAPAVPVEAPSEAEVPTQLPGLDASVCTQRTDELGPVMLTASQLPLRRGTGVTRFDRAPTSKSAPIEVCMPQGERAWLAGATCADGSAPSSAARSGSVGAGGVCGSIIDLYSVVCPEKTYEVYMDMYMCGSDDAGAGQP